MIVAPSRSPPPRSLYFRNKRRKHFLRLLILKRPLPPTSFYSWESACTSHYFNRHPNMQLGVAARNKVKVNCHEHEGIRKASAGHFLSPQEFKRCLWPAMSRSKACTSWIPNITIICQPLTMFECWQYVSLFRAVTLCTNEGSVYA
jgi:hypothetical protein